MKQLNCSVTGKATDIPYLTIDNGHTYQGVFESQSRCLFQLPDSEPPWGFTYFWNGKSERGRCLIDPATGEWADHLPEHPGAYESNTLAYAPQLGRLQADGTRFVNYTWAMMTGFCDYQLWLTGRTDQLFAVWKQARDLGANGRRVLGMMAFITMFDPRAFGSAFYTEMRPFSLSAAEHGHRIHFDVFADNQVFGLGIPHWVQTCDQLRPMENVLIGAGNEWPKNGFNPFTLTYPGVISSQGSTLSDAAPPMPGWGVRCWHGRRDYPKVWGSCEDMLYVGRGIYATGQQYAPMAPVVHDEPIGFAEIDIPNRRSTDPNLARALMLSSRAYGAGMTYHCEDSIYSRLLGPVQQTCARACFDAQG